MKKQILTAVVLAGLSFAAMAQKFFEPVTFTGGFPPFGTSYTARIDGGFTETFATGDWTTDWTNWYPNKVNYSSSYTESISGDISADKSISGVVELVGTVHVKNGATLTIAAGTIIRAGLGATLIISKGAKINAVGTRANPIVFTSNKGVDLRSPGDWAGVLIIGNSQVNTSNGTRQYEALPSDPLASYGGGRGAELNLAENSGEMRFVRIEFAGYNYLPDQELNGLTFGAVGSGTRINFVQVSYARDDSFEWFGGTSNHKYLVAFAGVDDDFDMDEGYAGNVQFILGVRNPSVFETAAGGTSNGFEHDNNTGLGSASAVVPGNNNPAPNTAPFISNATLIGPWANGAPTPGNKFGRGMEMRSAVATSVYNSVVMGYNTLAQLVHPTPTITPSIGLRLQNTPGITPAEYVNTHLIAVNTGSGFAFTGSTSNEPTPVISLSNYFTTNGNSTKSGFQTTAIFESVVTNFSTLATGISYAPKTSSFLAGVAASFPNLIAPKTADAATLASQPFGSVSKSSVAFGTKQVGETFTGNTFNVSFVNLTGAGVSVTSSSADFTATYAATNSVSGIVTVKATKTTAGSSNGTIIVNFGDARVSNISVSGFAMLVAPAAPILNVDAAALSFAALESTSSATYSSNNQQIAISGRNLASSVTVTAPSGYEVSLNSAPGGYASSLVIPVAANKTVSANVYVQLKSTVSGSNAGTLTIVSGSASTSVALSANTAAAIVTGTSITTDVFTGQVVSTVGTGSFSVRGDRLPTSIDIVPNTPNIELSLIGANGPWSSMVTLTTSGRITATGSNIWARFIGTTNPTTNGVQVGTISVSGVGQVIPMSIRLNAPGSIQSNYILTDASSPLITALGFGFNTKLRSTPFLYKANGNALIGQVSILGTNIATLRANSLISTNTFNTSITFAGTIMSDMSSAEITGTGTAFTAALFPKGLPLHFADGSLIGYVNSVTNSSILGLNAMAMVTSATGTSYGTSAIFYRRSQATISNSAGSPIAFTPTSFTAGVPNPVAIVTTLTGDNHDGPVNVGINPLLSASGYMFEVYLGTPTTFSGNSFSVIAPVADNGQLNQAITIRYVPNNITLLSLPALNVNAAHSTELLVLGNNRQLSAGTSSSDPRATLAINLRGNSQSGLTVSKTTLSKFVTYKGVASGFQKFNLSGLRVVKNVTITAPARFQLSTSSNFVGATNTLILPASVTGLTPSIDINVRYVRADVGADNGTISLFTEGIAPISVDVSGESIGFTSFLNLVSENNSSTISFIGTTMTTVSGKDLTGDVTITVSSGFGISHTQGGAPMSSITLSPNPFDFGDLANTVLYVTNSNPATATGMGTLSAMSAGATSVDITLLNAVKPTTSIEEAKVESKITLYPNPTEENATLAVEFSETQKINVDIYSITGTVVSSFADTVSNLTTYPVTGLSKGIYIVKVSSSKSVKTIKLIVQ